MKPDFKVNFAKRDVIACVCFTVVMILVLILGNTFGYVSADGVLDYNSVSFLTIQGYNNSTVYDPDGVNVNFINLVSQLDVDNCLVGQGILDNDFSDTGETSLPFGFNQDDFNYYLITGGPYPTAYDVYLWHGEEKSCVYMNNSGTFSIVTGGNSSLNQHIYVMHFLSYGDGTHQTQSPTLSSIEDIGTIYYTQVGCAAKGVSMNSGSPNIVMSNSYIYTIADSGNPQTEFEDFYNGGSNNTIYNCNYRYGSASALNGLDNLVGVSSDDDDSETSANNLYLNNPYWSFNLPHNNQLTSTNGTATFNAVPTDYQLEHPNQFDLHYWFQIEVTYTYKDSGDGGFSGAGHGFSILNSIRPQDSLGSTVTRSRTGIFKYRYNGSDSAVVPFSDFDGSQTFQTITVGTGWNKIFRQCYLSGNTSYNTFYDWWKDYGRTTATDNDSLPIVTSAKMKCYAQLYDSTSSSGICAYYYDFLTGESGVLDDSMGVNSNPYDFDTQDQYSDSSSGYGYVVQNNNNNQSVVINNNTGVSSDDTDSLKDQLEATLGDEQGGLIDTFKSKAQSNGWLMLMNSIFGFVPNSIWVDLATFLATCLGIFVVFLILRFLLDLL